MNAQGPWPLGGSPYEEIIETAVWSPVPGACIVEIDGTDLDTPEQADVEVHVSCYVATGELHLRFWNITTNLLVGTEQAFTNTALDLVKITGLAGLLATGANKYRLECKVSAAAARGVIHGSVLVIR